MNGSRNGRDRYTFLKTVQRVSTPCGTIDTRWNGQIGWSYQSGASHYVTNHNVVISNCCLIYSKLRSYFYRTATAAGRVRDTQFRKPSPSWWVLLQLTTRGPTAVEHFLHTEYKEDSVVKEERQWERQIDSHWVVHDAEHQLVFLICYKRLTLAAMVRASVRRWQCVLLRAAHHCHLNFKLSHEFFLHYWVLLCIQYVKSVPQQ